MIGIEKAKQKKTWNESRVGQQPAGLAPLGTDTGTGTHLTARSIPIDLQFKCLILDAFIVKDHGSSVRDLVVGKVGGRCIRALSYTQTLRVTPRPCQRGTLVAQHTHLLSLYQKTALSPYTHTYTHNAIFMEMIRGKSYGYGKNFEDLTARESWDLAQTGEWLD